MVLSWKKVDCPLQIEKELLPQEFKYLGSCSQVRCKSSVASDVDAKLVPYGEERVDLEGEALSLLVSLRSNTHLWS